MDVNDLLNAVFEALGDGNECDFTHESGIRIRCQLRHGLGDPPLVFRVAVPLLIEDPISLVYQLCYVLIAETGNNDTCDLLIRERSAHFEYHPDLSVDDEDKYVVYDAVVLDYLT